MGQSQEDFKILLNVLARVGVDGDVQGEFAKAKSMVHNFDSKALMAEQAKSVQNQGNLAPITDQPIPSTPEGTSMPPTEQNQGGMTQDQGMGQGMYDNL